MATTAKKLIKQALQFEKVERTPVCVLDGGAWAIRQKGLSFEDVFLMEDGGAELFYNAYKTLQSDIMYVGAGCFALSQRAMGSPANFAQVGQTADVHPLEDPAMIKEITVESVRERLLEDKGMQAIMRQGKIMRKAVGDEHYLSALISAPFTVAGQLLGVQELMMELLDDEGATEHLFALAVEVAYQFASLQLEAGANILMLADPVASGDLISPAMYEEFAAPLVKRLLDRIGDKAEFKLMHICGNTAARLDAIHNLGLDAFSMDSVDIGMAMEKANKDYAIMGNMSPSGILLDKTPAEIEEHCRALALQGGLNGGYIMMPGCDLPPNASLDNILAMVRAAHSVHN